MLKRNTKTNETVNFTRKEYFHRVAIVAANVEKDITFFNCNSGASGMTDMDTNWPAADNTIPAHISMELKRLGFSIITADGSPVLPKTLSMLSQAVVTAKIGEREIKNGTLAEFFKQPVAVNPTGTVLSDASAGPAYKELQNETAAAKAVFKFTVHIPAAIGQAVYLYALLDTDNSAK